MNFQVAKNRGTFLTSWEFVSFSQGLLHGVSMAPGEWSYPLTSIQCQGEEWVVLYLFSPYMPSWHGEGNLYPIHFERLYAMCQCFVVHLSSLCLLFCIQSVYVNKIRNCYHYVICVKILISNNCSEVVIIVQVSWDHCLWVVKSIFNEKKQFRSQSNTTICIFIFIFTLTTSFSQSTIIRSSLQKLRTRCM
jgi:hypothetical protein